MVAGKHLKWLHSWVGHFQNPIGAPGLLRTVSDSWLPGGNKMWVLYPGVEHCEVRPVLNFVYKNAPTPMPVNTELAETIVSVSRKCKLGYSMLTSRK